MSTIIGHCTKIKDGLEKEAKLWEAMERAMYAAFEKIGPEDKRDVKRLLERIPVATDYTADTEGNQS